jgi:Sulfotransferase family
MYQAGRANALISARYNASADGVVASRIVASSTGQAQPDAALGGGTMVRYQSPSHSALGTMERPITPGLVRPFARTARYALRGARARLRACVRRTGPEYDRPPIFLIGCGRSGTTLLGGLFAVHPMVSYVHEPYHLWAAMEPMTDFLQLYSHGEHHCILNEESVTARARCRFRCLFYAKSRPTLLEKSPINTMRIGYLNAISPEATFMHIVRDGIDVASSIERVAMITKKMAFRPPLNAWWGVDDAKWSALIRDGRASGHYPNEVYELATDAQLGAYEWLVSIREVDAWRGRLGQRLVELRYQDLTDQPQKTLRTLAASLSLTCPEEWVERAAAQVHPARSWPRDKPLMLPQNMCTDFNDRQANFDFVGRATELTPMSRTPDLVRAVEKTERRRPVHLPESLAARSAGNGENRCKVII